MPICLVAEVRKAKGTTAGMSRVLTDIRREIVLRYFKICAGRPGL